MGPSLRCSVVGADALAHDIHADVAADATPDGSVHPAVSYVPFTAADAATLLVANTEADVLCCWAFQSRGDRQPVYLGRVVLSCINGALRYRSITRNEAERARPDLPIDFGSCVLSNNC